MVDGLAGWQEFRAQLPSGFTPANRQVSAKVAVRGVARERLEHPKCSQPAARGCWHARVQEPGSCAAAQNRASYMKASKPSVARYWVLVE